MSIQLTIRFTLRRLLALNQTIWYHWSIAIAVPLSSRYEITMLANPTDYAHVTRGVKRCSPNSRSDNSHLPNSSRHLLLELFHPQQSPRKAHSRSRRHSRPHINLHLHHSGHNSLWLSPPLELPCLLHDSYFLSNHPPSVTLLPRPLHPTFHLGNGCNLHCQHTSPLLQHSHILWKDISDSKHEPRSSQYSLDLINW